MTPLNDWVLVLPVKPKDKTESGIYLPQQAVEKVCRGTIVAVGPKAEDCPDPGTPVVWNEHAGVEAEDSEGHILIKVPDLLGIDD